MAPATASEEQSPFRANTDNVLSPIIIDEKYSQTNIASPASVATGTLTLQGAVQEAAFHNRDVRGADLEVSRFKWDYLATETSRLPNLKVLSYLADQTIVQTPDSIVPRRTNAFLFMSAMMPVTQQYRIGLEARVVKLGREIARERLREKLDETRATVKAAYYKLALDASLLADVEDSITYLSELEKTVHDQVTKGNSLKVDELDVSAKLADAKFEQTKARNSYNIDREEFNHLLGRPLNSQVQIEVIPEAAANEINVEQAERQALSMRPEIRQADLRVRQLSAETKVIYSQYIPNVSVGAVYVALPGFLNQVIPKNIFAPGIFITYDAFDWGHKAMLGKARSKVEGEAKLTAESTREKVLIDLHKQINQFQEAKQLLETRQLSRAAARERLRVSINRYKFTADKLADVLLAQSSLSDQNNKYHQALLAYWEAKAQFDRAIGAE
jgi:outer membrane protein